MDQDKEAQAINEIIKALGGLDSQARARVLRYMQERFDLEGNQPIQLQPNTGWSEAAPAQLSHPKTADEPTDIRLFKESHNPKSAVQMAVLTAYYLQEIADVSERKNGIGADDITKYFKQAKYPLPAGKNGAADTLNNAKKAGYLESDGFGIYKLNPVGYNLVAYQMGENVGMKSDKRKRSKRKKK